MNRVLLSGRMTRDPELKTTAGGKSVCSFYLAVDRSKDESDFPTIVCWDETAEFCHRYLNKGRKIIVEGKLRTRNFEDRDGNKRTATEVYADHIEFADSKPE